MATAAYVVAGRPRDRDAAQWRTFFAIVPPTSISGRMEPRMTLSTPHQRRPPIRSPMR